MSEALTDERTELAAIARGDVDAFARWASAVERSLRLSLQRFAASVDVEVVVQETLLRVWQVAPRFVHDGRPRALLRFATTAAHHVALGELRRLGTTGALVALEDAPEPAVDPRPPDPHLRQAIVGCHEKLPDKPKAALAARLHSRGAEDDAALGQTLGMSLNTFLQNVTRARAALKACLEKLGIDVSAEALP